MGGRVTKTVLISGGSGLLALNWAAAIRERHAVVLALHRRQVALRGVASECMDLGSADAISAALDRVQPDIVIHAAGLTSVEACEENPSLARRINVQLAADVADACATRDAAFVHISTDHLFAGVETMLDETHPPAPLNVYAATKAEAEQRILACNPRALVVRTNFFGWGTSYRRSFSDEILRALRAGHEISLFEDVYYTPILAETLANTVHALLEAKASGVFHVVGDERLSKFEFGQRIASAFDLAPELITRGRLAERPELVRRPFEMSLSNAKARATLAHALGTVPTQIERLRELEALGISQELSSL